MKIKNSVTTRRASVHDYHSADMYQMQLSYERVLYTDWDDGGVTSVYSTRIVLNALVMRVYCIVERMSNRSRH